MEWSDFAGKKVALLGAGIENVSLIPWLTEAGAVLTVHQQFPIELLTSLKQRFPGVEQVVGEQWLTGLDRYDMVLRTPSLPVRVLQQKLALAEKKPEVSTAMNLFFALCKAQTIGVTGTKGKGTTTTMIAAILHSAGKKVVVAGNIGHSIFDQFNELDQETIVVLELSSFQLEDLTYSPDVAVLLPIVPDHLLPLSSTNPNYHLSFEEYVSAKAAITRYQKPHDLLVYAADSQPVRQVAERSSAVRVGVSGDDQTSAWYVTADGQVRHDGQPYLSLGALPIKGRHNYLNATVAMAVASFYNISPEQIRSGLLSFRPLPHRLETFLEKDGVTYVDDSYATAPDATMAALTAFESPVIWLGGGSSKGAEFTQLAIALQDSSVTEAILLGQEAPRIAQALRHQAPELPYRMVPSLSEAVKLAHQLARPGNIVLLSPGCASKDMFTNAADRGEQFQKLVHESV